MTTQVLKVENAKNAIFQSFPPLVPEQCQNYPGYHDLAERLVGLIIKVEQAATYLKGQLPDSLKLSKFSPDDWRKKLDDRQITSEEKDAVKEFKGGL